MRTVVFFLFIYFGLISLSCFSFVFYVILMPNAYTEVTTCSAHKLVLTVIPKFVDKYKRSVSQRKVKLAVYLLFTG